MAAKRQKIHFESVEELLGAPITKDVKFTSTKIEGWYDFGKHHFEV